MRYTPHSNGLESVDSNLSISNNKTALSGGENTIERYNSSNESDDQQHDNSSTNNTPAPNSASTPTTSNASINNNPTQNTTYI